MSGLTTSRRLLGFIPERAAASACARHHGLVSPRPICHEAEGVNRVSQSLKVLAPAYRVATSSGTSSRSGECWSHWSDQYWGQDDLRLPGVTRSGAVPSLASAACIAPTCPGCLGVLPCEVGDAAGGWFAGERGVAAVVIVGVQPVGEGVASFLF